MKMMRRKVWKLTIHRVRVKADRDSQNHRLVLPRFDGTHEECHHGALARTDVFEMVLRKPQNGEYLPDNTEEGRIVAMTLAVALRQALAGVLGISAAEPRLFCTSGQHWRMGNRY